MKHKVTWPANLNELEFACEGYLRRRMQKDVAHDLAHIRRVVVTAKQLARQENEDPIPIVLAAWLHDLVNLPKDAPDRTTASARSAAAAGEFLKTLDVPENILSVVQHAIEAHSFSAEIPVQSKAAQIVQDADRLDALGAIGISRCLLVGGSMHRQLYDEIDPFCKKRAPDDRQFIIDHFYTKLLKIVDSLGTATARTEGIRRLEFMQKFLSQLSLEIGVTAD